LTKLDQGASDLAALPWFSYRKKKLERTLIKRETFQRLQENLKYQEEVLQDLSNKYLPRCLTFVLR
jgi:hypothetical protein